MYSLSLIVWLSIFCLQPSIFCLSFTLSGESAIFRSMASMLCTQWMPLLRMAELCPICWLRKVWRRPKMMPTHKNNSEMAIIPRQRSATFNIISYICNRKDTPYLLSKGYV